jgi:hypothetical protein
MALVKYNFYNITFIKIQYLGSSNGIMFILSFIKTDQLVQKLKQDTHMHNTVILKPSFCFWF